MTVRLLMWTHSCKVGKPQGLLNGETDQVFACIC
jgi:hypothetical protein